jgi:hypothetical protein
VLPSATVDAAGEGDGDTSDSGLVAFLAASTVGTGKAVGTVATGGDGLPLIPRATGAPTAEQAVQSLLHKCKALCIHNALNAKLDTTMVSVSPVGPAQPAG